MLIEMIVCNAPLLVIPRWPPLAPVACLPKATRSSMTMATLIYTVHASNSGSPGLLTQEQSDTLAPRASGSIDDDASYDDAPVTNDAGTEYCVLCARAVELSADGKHAEAAAQMDAPQHRHPEVRAAGADLDDGRVRQQLAAREVELLDGVAERGQHAEHVLVRQLRPLVAVLVLSWRDEPRAPVEDARPHLLLG